MALTIHFLHRISFKAISQNKTPLIAECILGHWETLVGAWQTEGRPKARVTLICSPNSGSLRSLMCALLVVLYDLFKTSATVWCRCFCLSTNVRQTHSSPTSCCAHSSLSLAASAIAQLTIADISTNRNRSIKVLKCKAIAILFTHTERGGPNSIYAQAI